MAFTVNQEKGITLKDRNILVSAAAGSGKTSVLVERIIRKITDENNPVDIDRLLIMTFTNAAAKEMRDRIREAIDKKLDDDPFNENLIRQSMLVHNAMITTIHGFCQSVLRDHFGRLSIDPNFRVGDENECKLIRFDVLDKVLEELYEEASEEFLETVEWFSGNKNDEKLSEIVMGLYLFSQSAPNPSEFLENAVKAYDFASFEDYQNSTFVKNVVERTIEEIRRYIEIAKKAAFIISENVAIAKLDVTISSDIEKLEELEKCDSYDLLRRKLGDFTFDRLATVSDKTLSDEGKIAKQKATALRDGIKAGIAALQKKYTLSLKATYDDLSACKMAVNELRNIVEKFSLSYQEKKIEKNIIDFNDMEHMAIKVLSENSDIAADYREKFCEIYVDEYQDSNMSQETLVNLICRKENGGNLFMVGDVKQSIYRFRQARPDLFIHKYNSYSDEESDNQRIMLNDNFRSRKEVLQIVNDIFEIIMKRDVGNIEYDKDARLNYGAKYYDEAPAGGDDNTYKAELFVGIPEELSSKEMEAGIIVNRITQMFNEKMQVYDTKTSALRNIEYRDIVILVRSLRGWDEAFKEAFKDAGIPLSFASREGYFETIEVETVLAFLSIIDNPRQDIPLLTVLKSPVGDFTDKEIALIKINVPKDKKLLIDMIEYTCKECTCEQNEGAEGATTLNKEIIKKCRNIMDKLSYYREKSVYTPVYGIIREIVDKEYSDYVYSMDRGEQRMANLNMLINKAADYGKTSFTGLFNFVRYIELIRKYEIEDGEAGVLGEADNVVRVMTIHKSKGLEFPVCFIAGIEKNRNAMDERKSIVWDMGYGIGVDRVDVSRRVKNETLFKTIIKDELKRENIAEELRVLYVAMTRAREKLIMVGTCKDEQIHDLKKTGVLSCSSYLDLVALAISLSESNMDSLGIKYIHEQDIINEAVIEEVQEESSREEILSFIREKLNTVQVLEMDCEAENEIKASLPSKLSVSELKHMDIDSKMEAGEELTPEGIKLFNDTEPESYIPDFMREEGTTSKGGTFYGTAFHRILELWEYEKEDIVDSDIIEFAARMQAKNHMSKEMVDAIKPEDVAFFINSSLGKRFFAAKQAGKLFREQPFVIGMTIESQDVLVQGIIDAFIEEDDGIAIIDYKTDYVTDSQMLINRYEAQLEYYRKALEQLTGKHVKELIIYSSRLRQSIVF